MKKYKHRTINQKTLQYFIKCLKNDAIEDLQSGRDLHYRYYIAFRLLSGAGLRAGELINLKFSNLYVDNSFRKDTVILSIIGKGNKKRDIPLSLSLSKDMLKYENYCTTNYFKNDKDFFSKNVIFKVIQYNYSGPYTYIGLNKLLVKIKDKYGIKDEFTLHSFRHTYATIVGSKNPLLANILLGHSKIETTKIYLHLLEFGKSEELLKSIDILNSQNEDFDNDL